MSSEQDSGRLAALLHEFCATVGLFPDEIVRRQAVKVKGIDVAFSQVKNEDDHFYIAFQFGAIAPGRTLKAFRLMLEANILVYSKDTALLGMDPDTGGVVLSVRCSFGPETTGDWIADTLSHFGEHARYWQANILSCPDEMFNGVASGEYRWLRA